MILGIDPGLASCGWAVLVNKDQLSCCGCIVTKKSDDLADRLNKIYHQLDLSFESRRFLVNLLIQIDKKH